MVTVNNVDGTQSTYTITQGNPLPQELPDKINNVPVEHPSVGEGSFCSDTFRSIRVSDFKVVGDSGTTYLNGLPAKYMSDISIMPKCDQTNLSEDEYNRPVAMYDAMYEEQKTAQQWEDDNYSCKWIESRSKCYESNGVDEHIGFYKHKIYVIALERALLEATT